MRYAQPHELREGVVPVLQLRLSDRQFEEMFPVRTVDLDPLAAAEPSRAALVRLESGSYLVVTYGEVSHRAVVEVPQSSNPSNVVRELLSEVNVPTSAIEWRRDDTQSAQRPRKVAAPRARDTRKTAEKVAKARSTGKKPKKLKGI